MYYFFLILISFAVSSETGAGDFSQEIAKEMSIKKKCTIFFMS
jgi:hypothetical protein